SRCVDSVHTDPHTGVPPRACRGCREVGHEIVDCENGGWVAAQSCVPDHPIVPFTASKAVDDGPVWADPEYVGHRGIWDVVPALIPERKSVASARLETNPVIVGIPGALRSPSDDVDLGPTDCLVHRGTECPVIVRIANGEYILPLVNPDCGATIIRPHEAVCTSRGHNADVVVSRGQ